MITKTRKQGNSLTLTVPKEFGLNEGVSMQPKLLDNGILYEFVAKEDDFFDFTSDILSDLIKDGYQGDELLAEFNRRKREIPEAWESMIGHTDGIIMSREELEKELGL